MIEWSPPTASGATPASMSPLTNRSMSSWLAFRIETTPERHIANVRDVQFMHRRAAESVIVGADALDRAKRARTEARAAAVCDAKVHRYAEERDLKVLARRFPGSPRQSRRVEQGRNAGIGKSASIAVGKDEARDPREFRILRRVRWSGLGALQAFPGSSSSLDPRLRRLRAWSVVVTDGGVIRTSPKPQPKRFGNIRLKRSDVKPQRNASVRKAISYSGRRQTGPRFSRHRFPRPERQRES